MLGSFMFDPVENEKKWENLRKKTDQKLAELDEQIAQEKMLYEKIKSRLRFNINFSRICGAIAALLSFAISMIRFFNDGEVDLWVAVVVNGFFAVTVGLIVLVIDDLILRKTTIRPLEQQLEACGGRLLELMRQKKEIMEQCNDMMRAGLIYTDFDAALVYAMDREMNRRLGGIFDC